MAVAGNVMRGEKQWREKRETKESRRTNREVERRSHQEAGRSHPVTMAPVEVPAVTVTSPTTPFIYPTATTVTGPSGQPIVLLSPGICPSGRSSPLATPGTPIVDAAGNIVGGEVDDEFNLPVSLALLIPFLTSEKT